MKGDIEVLPCDREAALAYVEQLGSASSDDLYTLEQAFARHRIAAEQRAQAGGEVGASYDEEADVLYVHFPHEAKSAVCHEASAYVLWREGVDGDVVGVTIIDAVEQARKAFKGEGAHPPQAEEHTMCHQDGCSLSDIPLRFASCGCAVAPQADADRLREALREARDTLAKLKSDLAEEDAARHAQRIAVIDIDITRIDAILVGEG